MTVLAALIAAWIASTLLPSEQNPWASGGVALTKTASSGHEPGVEQARHVGQERGDVLGATLVDRRAGVGSDEQGDVPEVRCHLGRQMRAWPLAMQMNNPNIAQLRRPGHQGVQEDGWRGSGAMEIDLLA